VDESLLLLTLFARCGMAGALCCCAGADACALDGPGIVACSRGRASPLARTIIEAALRDVSTGSTKRLSALTPSRSATHSA